MTYTPFGAGPAQPVQVLAPPQQVNAIIAPSTPQRAEYALRVISEIINAVRERGMDGSITRTEMTKIEEHTYEVALMTAASYLKGDSFPEIHHVLPIVQPVPERRDEARR